MKQFFIILFSVIALGLFAQTAALNTAYTSFLKAEEAFEKNENKKALVYYKDAMLGYMQSLSEKPDLLPEDIKKRMEYCKDQLVIVRYRLENENTPSTTIETSEETDAKGDEKMALIIKHTKQAIAEDNLQAAKAMVIRGIQEDPTNMEVRFLASIIQCKLGKYNDSVSILTQLAEEKPESAKIYTTLGVSYMALNKISEAKTALQTAIKNNPDEANAYINMAQVLLLETPPNIPMAWANYNKSIELGGKRVPTLEAKLATKKVKYVAVTDTDTNRLEANKKETEAIEAE
jgi:tetratricopeptide (TPR) repeat protein